MSLADVYLWKGTSTRTFVRLGVEKAKESIHGQALHPPEDVILGLLGRDIPRVSRYHEGKLRLIVQLLRAHLLVAVFVDKLWNRDVSWSCERRRRFHEEHWLGRALQPGFLDVLPEVCAHTTDGTGD